VELNSCGIHKPNSPSFQVTTRTTALASVPHTSFALRFSDLAEIEAACKEGEEQRAARTIDWIGARICKRCTKWIEDMEKMEGKEVQRTPWWDELRRCAEGEHVPSKTEGWNHPVAGAVATACRLLIVDESPSHTRGFYDRPESPPSHNSPAFKSFRISAMG
jgi:hypothetical protein